MSRMWVAVLVVLGVLVGCSDDDAGEARQAQEPTGILAEAEFSATVREAMLAAGTVEVTYRNTAWILSGVARLGEDPALRMRTMGTGADRLEVVAIGDDAYYREGGAKYRSVPEQDRGRFRSVSPEVVVDLLADDGVALRWFRHIGQEEVDHQSFERYDLVFEPESVAGLLDVDDVGLVNFRFLVDDENRPRRVSVTINDDEIVTDLTGWGDPVDIEAPPESEMLPVGSYVPLTRTTYPTAVAGADRDVRGFRIALSLIDGSSMRGVFVREDDKIAAMEMTYVEQGETYESLCVDGKCYVRAEGEPTYLRFGGPEADEILSDMEASLSQGLIAQTQVAEAVLDTVTYRGPVETDDTVLHRYDIVMDTAMVAEIGGFDESEVPDMELEVLLTSEHSMRKASAELDGQKMTMESEPLDDSFQITAPPDHLVEDLPAA